MVEKEQVKRGANFSFEGGDCRVVSVKNTQIQWVCVDGIERTGQAGELFEELCREYPAIKDKFWIAV